MLQLGKPYGFIYLTTNLVNGKKYIGKKKFVGNWRTYLGSGVLISRAIKKYGRENFHRDIIHIAFSEQELNALEKQCIANHNACEDRNYYNVATGGDGGNTLAGKSEEEMLEFKNKCSENNKGDKNYWYGKSEKLKGENNPFYGRKHSEETRRKLSETRKGRVPPEEARRNMSLAQRKRYAKEGTKKLKSAKRKDATGIKAKRKVICLTTGEQFDSISEASRKTGISRTNINDCCRGKLKSAGKMKWAYLDEIEGCVVYA